MSDTLLSGRKKRELHKPKTFSPEPTKPSTSAKKAIPKNGQLKTKPKSTKETKKEAPITLIGLEAEASSSVLVVENLKNNHSQKVTKGKKKTPVQKNVTPISITSTSLVLNDVSPTLTRVVPSGVRDKSQTPIKRRGEVLLDVLPKKPAHLSALSVPVSIEECPSTSKTPVRQKAKISLRKAHYNSLSDDDFLSSVQEASKKVEVRREVCVEQSISSLKLENVDPTVSTIADSNLLAIENTTITTTAAEKVEFKPEQTPATSMGSVSIPSTIPEDISPVFKPESMLKRITRTPEIPPVPKRTPTTSNSILPARFSISLRTCRERKPPPSKDYDPTTGSNNRRGSTSSLNFITPNEKKKSSKPKSIIATPKVPPVAVSTSTTPVALVPSILSTVPKKTFISSLPQSQIIELPPIIDPEQRPKLTLKIPMSFRSGRNTPATPTVTPILSGRNTPVDMFARPVSSITGFKSTNTPLKPKKVPPIKLNLSKLASTGETPSTPVDFQSDVTAASSQMQSKPLAPNDVGSLINLATTSRSGRVRRPPPSKEYPGHINQSMYPSKRRELKPASNISAPSASLFNFPEFAIQPASAAINPSSEISMPLFSAPAMSRSDYAVNFNNATSMFGYHSPMVALNPTLASTPVSLQSPALFSPKLNPSTSTASHARPISFGENIFNRPNRNKSRGVADLAPSLLPRVMQKRASIATASASTDYYQQQQPGPSSAYMIPASAGTASHMFKYEDDYTNGYGHDTGRPGASQKRRPTGPTRAQVRRTKVVSFDSSGETLDTSDLNIDRTIIDYGDDAIEYLKKLHKHIAASMKQLENEYEENFFYREILAKTITDDEFNSNDEDTIDVGSPEPVYPPHFLNTLPPEHNRTSAKLVRQLIDLLPKVERKTLEEVMEVAQQLIHDFDLRGKALLDLVTVTTDQYYMELAIANRPNSIALFHVYSIQNATKFRNIIFLHFSFEFMEAHAWLLQNLDEQQLTSYLTLLKYLRPAGTTMGDLFVEKASNSIAITNEVMENIVIERARDPYIRMLTQLTRGLKNSNIYLVLVYPGITFDDASISPIYHAHEQIFLGLSNIGAVVEKLAINNPFPKDRDPNMYQATDYAIIYVRNKLKEIVNRRVGDRIFVAAFGMPCVFVHEAILKVSGVSGLIDLAIPIITPTGSRAIVGDTMLQTYCPTLLVIGEEAENVIIPDVVDCLGQFMGQAGMILVGGADESLIVDVDTLTKYGITQACINRLIIHHIMDFIEFVVKNTQNEYHTKKLTLPNPFITTTDFAAHVTRDDKDIDPALTFEEDLKLIEANRKQRKSPSPSPTGDPTSSTMPPLTNGYERGADMLNESVLKYFGDTKKWSDQPKSNDPSAQQVVSNGPFNTASKVTSSVPSTPIQSENDRAAAQLLALSKDDPALLQFVQPRIIDEEMELENQRAAAALLELSDSEDPFHALTR